MKKLILFPLLFSIFMLNVASMCSNDDDNDSSSNLNASLVTSNMVQGNWKVTLYSENGVNKTTNFAGYVFNFATDNVVTATSSTSTMVGTWLTGSFDSSLKMILTFSQDEGDFEEISEDWKVQSSTSSEIELKHTSGGDGSIDLLTFQKVN